MAEDNHGASNKVPVWRTAPFLSNFREAFRRVNLSALTATKNDFQDFILQDSEEDAGHATNLSASRDTDSTIEVSEDGSDFSRRAAEYVAMVQARKVAMRPSSDITAFIEALLELQG